jgi:hypothetical protein
MTRRSFPLNASVSGISSAPLSARKLKYGDDITLSPSGTDDAGGVLGVAKSMPAPSKYARHTNVEQMNVSVRLMRFLIAPIPAKARGLCKLK